jgi:hypothetical protein
MYIVSLDYRWLRNFVGSLGYNGHDEKTKIAKAKPLWRQDTYNAFHAVWYTLVKYDGTYWTKQFIKNKVRSRVFLYVYLLSCAILSFHCR